MTNENTGLTAVYDFVAELHRMGLRHVVISPGSRSTPLTLSFLRHGGFRVWSQLDERSAAFFALGIARATGFAPALVCTSGTAAGNYTPAIMEAHSARLPLLVLTADRPPELHDVGSNQTVRQSGMYTHFVKWQHEAAVPEATVSIRRYFAETARRALLVAESLPRGPVHLNFPFREPLIPPSWNDTSPLSPEIRPEPGLYPAQLAPSPAAVRQVAAALAASRRPLLVLGPMERTWNAERLHAWADAYCIPVLADPLSGGRWSSARTSIRHYDVLLRDEVLAETLGPDIIIRLGHTPTSKSLGRYLSRHAAVRQVVVDESPLWRDPFFTRAEAVQSDVDLFIESVADEMSRTQSPQPRTRAPWMSAWRDLDDRVGDELERGLAASWQEAAALMEFVRLLPEASTLMVGNSMPVRDLDTFWRGGHRSLRILANRGLSGIDGVVSTAAGAAAATPGPIALCVGDVSFYHDLNGLLAVGRHGLDLLVFVIHNDGGGIFSFLPQAAHKDTFAHFRTPHGLEFEPAVAMYGGRFYDVEGPDSLQAAVAEHFETGGLTVIQARFQVDENHTRHQEVIAAGLERVREYAQRLTVSGVPGGGA
ncbi:2-succinyl-5-enolpyruvyl-6-hydroxy-3-cyclohexene-1-carboxylic-acid synthase [Alicyclobacillus shizuokensis]|uniref:2-succinyl-5-enolpyruvyl-6-hydroxy-3- cyclohexene-1-carboxylic-acid synthase n=1 Tax=Alicyclobacillus shizuokensis TaxID=392014 RepID=UPI0008334D2A|nr:2-succinyl-5-enolpyruvyl-6-hydroxy-3-cyclohexene-1-carboxylic-acid synthase [Alicyclobacillus shizuokensis]MCL6626856.1 2-succinyl-5-enolpyruvyl-6-hydroxy-3-cyclohexene-1-carboxylic-acid synthase [Alicyclobacillus shizuokensis]